MLKVPTVIEERYTEIVEIIEGFCNEKLNEEYLSLAQAICVEICNIEESSIRKGKAASWACGIVHALGLKNGLFNGKEKPSIKAGELYQAFGVSSSTGLSKSKEVRTLINIDENKWDVKNVISSEDTLSEIAVTVLEEEIDLKEDAIEDIIEVKEIEELELNINDEDLLKANKIIEEAAKIKNYNKKKKLAEEAIKVSENCVEAYIILSYDNSLSKEKQREYAEKAVNAAKGIIGEENIDKYIGKFLVADIAKPYFSSIYRLGKVLWSLGERNLAIENFKTLLRISPEDTLVTRATLVSWLLVENRDEEAYEILEKYKSDKLAATKYSKALYLYKNGYKDEAERALKIASVGNRFVIQYIIKQKRVPETIVGFRQLGTDEEALNYMKVGEVAWREIPGASEWVKEFNRNQPF